MNITVQRPPYLSASEAMANAVRRMEAARPIIARTLLVTVKDGARVLVHQPWRFRRLGIKDTGNWAHECELQAIRLAGWIQSGREGHWTFDHNRVVAGKQASLALRWFRRFADRVPA